MVVANAKAATDDRFMFVFLPAGPARNSSLRAYGNALHEAAPSFLVIARHVLEHGRAVLSQHDMQAERQRRARDLGARLRPRERILREVLEDEHAKARRLELAAGLLGGA